MIAMVVVPVVMPVTVAAGRRAAHGDAARLTELPVLRLHAGRDPCHVGDDIGTKPHRIGRARLTGRIATLSGCAVETTKQQGEQGNRARQLNNPHGRSSRFIDFIAQGIFDEIGRCSAQTKSRPRGHLLAQRWRKYDPAR